MTIQSSGRAPIKGLPNHQNAASSGSQVRLGNVVSETRRVIGSVKWSDPKKGFGFVVADEGGPDILLHANVLRNFGQSSVAAGAKIEIEVLDTARGAQAVAAIRIEPPDPGTSTPLAEFEQIDPDVLRAAPLLPSRVKWFDKAKGFGFANVFGDEQDVFIHREVLRCSGLADLQPGEAVCIRVIPGKRGKMAAEICPWDRALV